MIRYLLKTIWLTTPAWINLISKRRARVYQPKLKSGDGICSVSCKIRLLLWTQAMPCCKGFRWSSFGQTRLTASTSQQTLLTLNTKPFSRHFGCQSGHSTTALTTRLKLLTKLWMGHRSVPRRGLILHISGSDNSTSTKRTAAST